jgi:hypothetical protein
LRHTLNSGLVQVAVPEDPKVTRRLVLNESLRVATIVDVCELKPGETVSIRSPLHRTYESQLVSGETYELLWPGGKIFLWDWGTIHEHLGKELRPDSERPELILPGGASVTITTEVPKPLQRVPSPPPVAPTARMYESFSCYMSTYFRRWKTDECSYISRITVPEPPS